MRKGRVAMILAAAAIVPSCGGHPDQGPPVPAATTLFSDDFNGPTLGPDWSVTGAGSISFDSTGTPAPALRTGPDPTAPPGVPASLGVTATVPPFPTPSLRISVDLLVRTISESGGQGTASVVIFDAAGSGTLAVATLSLTGSTTTAIDFEITGSPSATLANPGGWRTLEFVVDAAGVASWSLDGADQIVKPGFPIADVGLSLRNDSDSDIDFDSVLVTSP